MAAYYIDSNAVGANDGSSWTDAYSGIVTALSGKSAGDVFYVASNHLHDAVSTTITYTWPSGSALNPVVFISASTAASPPITYTRGASEKTSSGTAADIIFGTTDGAAVFIGFDFLSVDNIGGANDMSHWFYDCKFEFTSATSGSVFQLYDSNHFENCEFVFAQTNNTLQFISGSATFVNCKTSGTAITNALFDMDNFPGPIYVRGFDASSIASTCDLIGNPSASSDSKAQAFLANIRVPNSWTGSIVDAAYAHTQNVIEAYNVDDDSDTIYQIYIDRGQGTVRSETTTVHTGTYDGTGKHSYAMTCITAAEECAQPMWMRVTERWMDANPTIKVNVTSDATLTDQDFWIEVESPDSAAGSLSRFVRSRNANYFLGSGTTLTSGSGWTSPKTNQYEVSLTVTSSQAGVHRVFAYLASDAAVTVYIDPRVVVT